MIDTDKYEGHTEGPWTPYEMNAGGWTVGNFPLRWKEADKQLIADAPLLLAEVKRLREDNHVLRMIDWEYERVWEWLMENADYTCRKLLLLIEEWKEEDGLVTIGGMTYEKEMVE
jgi:hypothetical protein